LTDLVFDKSTNINVLILNRNQIESIKRADLKRIGKDFIYIDLSDNQISFIETNAFIDMESMKFLGLAGNKIKSIDHIGLKSTKITNLELGYNQIESINIDFKIFNKLKILNLTNNRIKSIDFLNFSFHPMITSLDLSQNQIDNITNQRFEVLNKLRRIDLSKNPIKSFKNVKFNTSSLAKIRVSIADLNDEGINDLRNSIKPQIAKQLESLGLVYFKSVFVEDDDYPLNCSTTFLFLRNNILFNLFSLGDKKQFYQVCSNFILE
jgi:Leucine-rich repeat (LRR) protein